MVEIDEWYPLSFLWALSEAAKKNRWELPPGVAVFSNNPILQRETENFSIKASCWIFLNVRLAVDPIRTQPEQQRKSANLSYVKWSRTAWESAILELENMNHISSQAKFLRISSNLNSV